MGRVNPAFRVLPSLAGLAFFGTFILTILPAATPRSTESLLEDRQASQLLQVHQQEVEAPRLQESHHRNLLTTVVPTEGLNCHLAGILMLKVDCKYDLTNDGVISVIDVLYENELVMEHAEIVMQGHPEPTPPPKTDLNKDGKLQVGDIILLLNVVLFGIEMEGSPIVQSFQGDVCFAPEEAWDKQCFGAGPTTPASLEGINHVEGFVRIVDTNVTSLEELGFGSLQSIGQMLYIQSNDELTSLEGLEQLKSVGGGIRVAFNDKLESISALDGLENAGGHIMFARNHDLCESQAHALASGMGKDQAMHCCEFLPSDFFLKDNKEC